MASIYDLYDKLSSSRINFAKIERNIAKQKKCGFYMEQAELCKKIINTHDIQTFKTEGHLFIFLTDPINWRYFTPDYLKRLLIITYCHCEVSQSIRYFNTVNQIIYKLQELYNNDYKKVNGIFNICKLYQYDFLKVYDKLFIPIQK